MTSIISYPNVNNPTKSSILITDCVATDSNKVFNLSNGTRTSSAKKVLISPARPLTSNSQGRRTYCNNSNIKNQEVKRSRNEMKFQKFVETLQKTREKSKQIMENNFITVNNIMTPLLPSELKYLTKLALREEEYLSSDPADDKGNDIHVNSNNSPQSIKKKPVEVSCFEKICKENGYSNQLGYGDSENRRSVKNLVEKMQNESKKHLRTVLKSVKHERKNEKTVIKYLTKVPSVDPQSFQKPKLSSLDPLDTKKRSSSNENLERRSIFKANLEGGREGLDLMSIPNALNAIKNLQFDDGNTLDINDISMRADKQNRIRSMIDIISRLKRNYISSAGGLSSSTSLNGISPLKAKSDIFINTMIKQDSQQINESMKDQYENTASSSPIKAYSRSQKSRLNAMNLRKKKDMELDQILSGTIIHDDKKEVLKQQQNLLNKPDNQQNIIMGKNQIYDHLCEINYSKMESPLKMSNSIYDYIKLDEKKLNSTMSKSNSNSQINKKKLKKALLLDESLRKHGIKNVEEATKYLRKGNEEREQFLRYCTKMISNVSPEKAQKTAKINEKEYFNELANIPLNEAYLYRRGHHEFIRNKSCLLNAYNNLEQKCDKETKSTQKMATIVQTKFEGLNDGLKIISGMNNQKTGEFDEYLIDELKKDAELEKQNLSGTDLNVKILRQTMKFKKKGRSASHKG